MDKNVSQWDEQQLKKILEDLEIDVPVMTTRIVGDRLEISLYGGKILTWAEEQTPLSPGGRGAGGEGSKKPSTKKSTSKSKK